MVRASFNPDTIENNPLHIISARTSCTDGPMGKPQVKHHNATIPDDIILEIAKSVLSLIGVKGILALEQVSGLLRHCLVSI